MKTLGLIGGLTWFATSIYYKTINQLVGERLGDSHSAKLFLYSVDFDEMNTLQEKNDLQQIEVILSEIAQKLEGSGADCLVMCANTAHLFADAIRQKIQIPLIHIAEETTKAIVEQEMKKVGLIGTKFTMEHPFFKDRLEKSGVKTLIPGDEDRDFIHASIFNELTKGSLKDETKNKYLEIIEKLRAAGAQGVIFGCAELSLFIDQLSGILPIFDTTEIHSRAAVDFALSGADDVNE
jgi:aspartate racemase